MLTLSLLALVAGLAPAGEQYRSYVINDNLGKDLVHRYVDARGGTADHPGRRWAEFAKLISSPRLPSGL